MCFVVNYGNVIVINIVSRDNLGWWVEWNTIVKSFMGHQKNLT